MKVSVILPVYNNKEDVLNAIKSVEDQTYKDWDLTVVDDCSTDGTFESLLEHCKEKDYIKLLRNKKNSGCYVAMNEGINASDGDLICRIDSDDRFDPTKLEKQVRIIKEKSVDAVTCDLLRETNRYNCTEVGLLYKRKVVDKVGYYDSIRYGADTEFICRVRKVFGVYHLKEVLYYAKKREGSLTSTNKGRMAYVHLFQHWHQKADPLYIPYPLEKRPFEVHKNMLV